MRKINFTHAFNLHGLVVSGYKTMTRRIGLPKYNVGEVLAVAQPYSTIPGCEAFRDTPGWNNKLYVRADLMPHQIKITKVYTQKLQDITPNDCISEGVKMACVSLGYESYFYLDEDPLILYHDAREAFTYLIEFISHFGIWDENPTVTVYEFQLIK